MAAPFALLGVAAWNMLREVATEHAFEGRDWQNIFDKWTLIWVCVRSPWTADRSTLITSNLPFDEWTETQGSERLTGALLDRITHHVNILEMNGAS